MASKKKTFLDMVREGEFVISIQLDPPGVGGNVEDFKETVGKLIVAGARVFDINSSRRISHDSIHLAETIIKPGLDVIPHVTTRDSSINGLANQILAAHDLHGLNSFLVITGDPYEARQAMVPSSGVFQTDSVGAIKLFNESLRKNPRNRRDQLVFAAAINQNELDLEREGKRIFMKIEAGADFFMSQPVFNREQAFDLMDFYLKYSRLPVLVGIWPITSLETAKKIKNGEIVGVSISDEVYAEAERIGSANKSNLKRWGLAQARKLVEYVKFCTRANGIYIVAPSRNPQTLLDLLPKIL